jgi:protein SCO1/2
MRRLIIFALVGVAVIVFGALAALRGGWAPSQYRPAIEILGGGVLPDFTLMDQNGRPFTLSSVKGKAVIIFFGYTSCPDVCPLVLSKFKEAIQRLGPDAERVAFIFVTVDPERDTPEVLKRFVERFSEKIIALSGSPHEVEAVLRLYNIMAAKVPTDKGGHYLMNHYSLVMGADRNHVLRLALSPDMNVEEYVQGAKWLLTR